MLNLDTPKRCFYRDHVLSCDPQLQEDGRYQARVAITCLGGERTVSQRFLDLELCATREEAISKAHHAGIAWIDREWLQRELRSETALPIR